MMLKIASVTAALALSAPAAFGITVNVTDFVFGPSPLLNVTGLLSETVDAGEFTGVIVSNITKKGFASPNVVATGGSFEAYCAELDQIIAFGTSYNYTQTTGAAYFTPDKLTDMSRLFTATTGFVKDADTSAAMQAAVWEVIYQDGSSYDLYGGNFQATAYDSSDTSFVAALDAMNDILGSLDSYAANYKISVLVNPKQQDLLIATSIPEPGTWALMAAGLLAVGSFAGRKAKARDIG